MTPSEYERFKDIFLKVGDKEKYTLQELGASKGKVTTAKIRLNNSYYEEDVLKGWKMHHGVFIDIFILHTCPDSKIAQLWQYFWAKYLVVKGVSNKPQYARRHGVAGMIVNMFRFLPKRFLVDFALTQVYHWRSVKTEYYCNFLGKALFRNGKYKYNDFATTKRLPFETIELNVPSGLERFLTDRFGNYMQVPSIERIKYEQHASTWDLGDYDYSDRSDEKYLL